MVFDIFTLVEGLWIILPAYAANGLAPLVKLLPRHPIDGGRSWRGRPIFGEGKSWEGLLLGAAAGMLVALVEQAAFPFLPWPLSEEIHGVALNIVPMTAGLGLLLGLGAMLGDLLASFAKRRAGLPRGAPVPLLDQDDFVVGAFAFASLLIGVELGWVILYLIITPLIHLLASHIGYRLHLKREPF